MNNYGFVAPYSMTVKEMKELLMQFHDDDVLQVYGGEDGNGGYAYLCIYDHVTKYEIKTVLEG